MTEPRRTSATPTTQQGQRPHRSPTVQQGQAATGTPTTRQGTPTVQQGGSQATGPGSAPVFPDQLLDRFTPLECRGYGTEGAVWRCRTAGDGTEVAVKVHWVGRPMHAELLEHLRNPAFRRHVPEIHEHGTVVTPHGEVAWVAMEYLATTLGELVGADGVGLARAGELVAELAAALDFWQRTVARNPLDFKPDNLMIRPGSPGQIVIADFGGVSAFTASQQQGGTIMAAVAYSPPEEVWQEKRSPWPWWSLGEIVYLLVTGHTRFQRPDGAMLPDQVILRIRHVGELALDTVPDPRWQLLIQGLLTRDPYDRWTYEEVTAWLAGESPPVVAAAARNLPKAHRPITFADGRTFTDPGSLAAAMLDSWRAAEDWLSSTGRQELLDWLTKEELDRRFDTSHLRGLGGDSTRLHKAVLAFGAAFAPGVTPRMRGQAVDADGLTALLSGGGRGFAEARALLQAQVLGLAAGYRCRHGRCAGDRCTVLDRAAADLTGLVSDVENAIAAIGTRPDVESWEPVSEGELDRAHGLALHTVLNPAAIRRERRLLGDPPWWRELRARAAVADPHTHAGRVVLVTAAVLRERAFAERLTAVDDARARLGLHPRRIVRTLLACALGFVAMVAIAWIVGALGLSALAFQEDPVAGPRALADEPAYYLRLAPALLVLAVEAVLLGRGRPAWLVAGLATAAVLAVLMPRLPVFTLVSLPGPVADLAGAVQGAWRDNVALGVVVFGAVALACAVGAVRLLPGRLPRTSGPVLGAAPATLRWLAVAGLFALMLPAVLWAAGAIRLTVTEGVPAATTWVGPHMTHEQASYLLVLLLAAMVSAIGWPRARPVLAVALLAAAGLGLWAAPIPAIEQLRYPVATGLLTGISELWAGGAFWGALLVYLPLSAAAYRLAVRVSR
jgi:hypothetical protein